MAEEVKKNKLKIPVSPEESRTEISDVSGEGFSAPKTKKNSSEKTSR